MGQLSFKCSLETKSKVWTLPNSPIFSCFQACHENRVCILAQGSLTTHLIPVIVEYKEKKVQFQQSAPNSVPRASCLG